MGEVIDSWVMPGMQGGPLMHVIAGKAVAFGEALTDDFDKYIIQVMKNAKAFADELLKLGFNLVSGGTDNHLILVDLQNKNITGKEAQNALDLANITCNKNAIPGDPRSPFITSGIRLGSAALTTRGLKEDDFRLVANFISKVVDNFKNEDEVKKIGAEVYEFASRFPLYKDYDGTL